MKFQRLWPVERHGLFAFMFLLRLAIENALLDLIEFLLCVLLCLVIDLFWILLKKVAIHWGRSLHDFYFFFTSRDHERRRNQECSKVAVLKSGHTWLNDSLRTSKAWDPLPGAPLRLWFGFVAALRIRLGAGSGFSSAALFGLLI